MFLIPTHAPTLEIEAEYGFTLNLTLSSIFTEEKKIFLFSEYVSIVLLLSVILRRSQTIYIYIAAKLWIYIFKARCISLVVLNFQ